MSKFVRIGALTSAVSLSAACLLGSTPAAAQSAHGFPPPYGGGGGGHGDCPKPQSLVKGTKWDVHHLAPGVTLSEGVRADKDFLGSAGDVQLHVLRINTRSPNLRFEPLVDHVDQRTPLSQLAHGKHLVAATNTGFFDFSGGAPNGPVFDDTAPISMGAKSEAVIGFTADNALESARAWLDAKLTAGKSSFPVAGYNYSRSPGGIAIYTNKWSNYYQVPWSGRDAGLFVEGGQVISGLGNHRTAPSKGALLVGTDAAARQWLERLRKGDKVSLSMEVRTNAKQPIVEGYSVGKQIVKKHGQVLNNLSCREPDTQAARTAVGWTDTGKHMIIAIVADEPGSAWPHGLDQKEMSRLLVDLGADRAYEWDGSGSSELIARTRARTIFPVPPPSRHRPQYFCPRVFKSGLSIRNYCADGDERPMPVGFGIFNYPVKHTKKK